jgi:hypothetical protein
MLMEAFVTGGIPTRLGVKVVWIISASDLNVNYADMGKNFLYSCRCG